MWCALCKAAKKKEGSWCTSGCVTIKLEAVREHEKSKAHRDAVSAAQNDPTQAHLALMPDDVKTFDGWKHAFYEHYKPLLHDKDLRVLKQEYDSYLVFARTRQLLAPRERLQQWLTSEFGKTFYNISILMMVCLALPVSSAEAERVFSTMKRIKTDPRNRLGPQSLDDLMMISCNSPSPDEFDYSEAVYRWYVADNRRVKLGDGFLAYLAHRFPWVKMRSR
jgi:hypothetical protein